MDGKQFWALRFAFYMLDGLDTPNPHVGADSIRVGAAIQADKDLAEWLKRFPVDELVKCPVVHESYGICQLAKGHKSAHCNRIAAWSNPGFAPTPIDARCTSTQLMYPGRCEKNAGHAGQHCYHDMFWGASV